jgi:hypothetical protein
MDRPGQAVRNVLRGDPMAAARQVADFVVEPLDAALPGDWVPDIARREDYVSGSELAGIKTPIASTAADIGIGVLTDPLTYLSFGALPAAKAAATGMKYGVTAGIPFTGGKASVMLGKGSLTPVDPLSRLMGGADMGLTAVAGKLDEMKAGGTQAGQAIGPVTRGYEDLKAGIRRATGSEKLSPTIQKQIQEGVALGNASAKVSRVKAEAAMIGLDKEERVLLTLANRGIDIGDLKPTKASRATVTGSTDFQENVGLLARKYGKDEAKLKARAQAISELGGLQMSEAKAAQAMDKNAGIADYLKTQWLFDSDTNSLKGRTLKTPEAFAKFLNEEGVGIELDSAKLLLDRANSQGSMITKAHIAKMFAPANEAALNQGLADAAKAAIAETPGLHRDEVRALTDLLNGMPARGGVFNVLAKMTKPVKGAMVYGVVLPKIGSLVRNKIGMGMQAAATPGVREQAFTHLNPYNILMDIGKAADEAYGMALFGKSDEISRDIIKIEEAYKKARSGKEVEKILRDGGDAMLADAVKHGVMDGFVSTEEILSKIDKDPKWAKFWDIYNAPGKMFSYIEQRGRLQTFKNLHPSMGGAEAGRKTKEALYDYTVNSPENRNLRDVIPFAQFMVKSIPQQAKWLSEKPAVGAAMAPLFYDASGDEPPVYPWMQGKSRVSLGTDATGNPLFATGFGLPMESIDVLPNLSGSLQSAGRDLSQGMLASTAPVLKTAAAITTGKDPYFGTPFGTYGKLPIIGEAGGLGRAINVIGGTGFLEPLGFNLIRQANQATDETKTGIARTVDLATGAKLISVDPNIAEQRAITSYLEQRPDIQQYRTFYSREPDAEFSELMTQLQQAKARAKAAREAAAQAQ